MDIGLLRLTKAGRLHQSSHLQQLDLEQRDRRRLLFEPVHSVLWIDDGAKIETKFETEFETEFESG